MEAGFQRKLEGANCINRTEGLLRLQHIAVLAEMAESRCIMVALGTVGTKGTHTEVSVLILFSSAVSDVSHSFSVLFK